MESEKHSLEKIREEDFPYSYIFPSGETFEAVENKDGTAKIVLKKDGKIIMDFLNLLPEGFRFARPTLVNELYKNGEAVDSWDSWSVDLKAKLVEVDKFEKPQDVLALLHEIGHAQIDLYSVEHAKGDELSEEWSKTTRKNPIDWGYLALINEEHSKVLSVRERRAWAFAVQTLRALKQNYGLDFKTLFPTLESLEQYINESLVTHKEQHKWVLKYDPDFENELKKLYVKDR